MPYYDVAYLVTVTKTNMIDEMPCGHRILQTPGVRISHWVPRRAGAVVSAALEVSCRSAPRSQQLQNLTILIVKSHSILNALPSLQVLSGALENAVAESESTLQSSRGGWERLEVHKNAGEGNRSVWEVCIWLPDQITFCWCIQRMHREAAYRALISCRTNWSGMEVYTFGLCLFVYILSYLSMSVAAQGVGS